MNRSETCSAIALDELMRTPAPARKVHHQQPLPGGPLDDDRPYRKPNPHAGEQGFHQPYPAIPGNWQPPSSVRERARLSPTRMGYLELDHSVQTRQQVQARREPKERGVTSNPDWMSQFDMLWVLAIIFYGFADLATTAWAFSLGATELNPVLDPLLQHSMWKFIQFKALVLITLMLLSTWLISVDSDARIVPLLTTGVGLFLMVNNLTVVGGLEGWF